MKIPHASATVAVLLAVLLTARASDGLRDGANSGATNGAPRIVVPAGIFKPVVRAPDEPKELRVGSFRLEERPVSNGDFLRFVRGNPRWRRSQVRRLFADENYLRHWRGDLDPGDGPNAGDRQPVTWVSWFAAKSYAAWVGGRLPTTTEWEYAAAARPGEPASARAHIARWYATPSPERLAAVGDGPANPLGLRNLHGLVWEWTSDFDTALLTGDSRGDTGIDRQLFCGAGSMDGTSRDDFPTYLRFGFRGSLRAAYTVHNLGFRCAFPPDADTNSETSSLP